MSTSIEQRVVQMRFDNKQFEAGVAQSMSTLDKFKAKLNFKGAADSFNDISKAADSVSLDSLITQTDNAGNKFDALAIIAISALNRITNEAISAGTKLVKSLSIDQVSSGWQKYEARTAAVQTLVNATGRSVEDIERYMSKLMTYSDETSYGFADMTAALGTMVSAGGDIDKLVPVLEGFGNAVSFVGKGANEYSRAIIQLSQGYGRNALMLEDWKSIEQTLGGAKQLKEVFIEVGEELGKIQKGQIDVGTFNETLRNKWLDQEVIEEALGRFAEMTERAFAMIEAGEAETVSEAYEILSRTVDDYRIRAAKAAQEAKSFTEAIDATKDAVSTKWMESFQIIFGNYEEATRLWTELTNTLYELFAASGDVRNEILSIWKSIGGRETMIKAFKAAFEALAKPVSAVRDAIHEIFFPGTTLEKGIWLARLTNNLRAFFESLILSDEAVTTLRKSIKILLLPVYALYQALRVVTAFIGQTIITVFSLIDALLSLPSKLGDAENPLKRIFGDERYARIVSSLTIIIENLGNALHVIGSAIFSMGKAIASAFSSRLQTSISKLLEALNPIAGWILDRIVDGFEMLASFDYSKIVDWAVWALDSLIDGFTIILYWSSSAIDSVRDFFASFADKSPIEILRLITAALRNFKDNLVEFVKGIGFDKVFPPLIESGDSFLDVLRKLDKAMGDFIGKLTPAKILVSAFGVSMVWTFTQIAIAISAFTGIANSVSGVLDGITGVLQGFQKRIKGSPILQVAVAVGVLAVSLGALAMIDSDKLYAAAKSLGAIMVLFAGLTAAVSALSAAAIKFPGIEKNILNMSKSMIVMSASVAILSAALLALSFVDVTDIGVKLLILAGMLAALVVSIKFLSKSMGAGIGDAAYIIAFAASLNLMVMALAKLTEFNLQDHIGTLATIAIIIGMMVALGKASQGVKPTSGFKLLLMAGVLLIFIKAVDPIAQMDLSRILQALFNMSLIFAALIGISKLSKIALENNIGLNVAGLAAGLLIMYYAIKTIGSIETGVLVRGVLAIGTIMVFLGLMNALSRLGPVKNSAKIQGSFIALSAAIVILGIAINYIGGLELGKVIQGTVVVMALMGMMTLLGSVMGSAQKATGAIVAMAVCIGLIVSSVALLTLLDGKELLVSATTLAIAFGGMALMFKSINNINLKTAIFATAMLVIALNAIKDVFIALDGLENSSSLLYKAGSIGIILVALGASFALISNNKTFDTASWGRIFKTLTMTGLILAEVAIVFGLFAAALENLNNPETLIYKASALGVVLLAMGKSLDLFNVKTAGLKNIGKTTLLILGMSTIAAAVVVALSKFTDPDGILWKVSAFSAVLLAMTGAIALISLLSNKLKGFDKSAITGITTLGITVAALSAVTTALIAWMSILPDDDGLLKKVAGFSVMLLAMTAAIAIISQVSVGLTLLGSAGGAALVGAGVATLIVLAIGALVELIGWMFTKFESLETYLTVAENVIPRIGAVIGSFFGEIIGGFAETALDGVGQSLEDFGAHLSNFANNIQTFVSLKIPPEFEPSIMSLVNAITAITAVEFIQAILNTDEETPFQKFGEQLNQFAPQFVEFANTVSNIPQDAVLASATCLEALGTVLANIPVEGGIMGVIFGNKSLDGFGTGLSSVAQGIVDYATILNNPNISEEAIRKTNKLTAILIELANKVPMTGGLQVFFGTHDMGKFGIQLQAYGSSLGMFIASCNKVYESYDEDAFIAVKTATETLSELANSVPKTGLLMSFLGKNDIGAFGTQIALYGLGLAGFFAVLEGVTIDQQVAEAAKLAGKTLAELADDIPKTGGIVSFFTGSSDMGTFGTQIGLFGWGLNSFYTSLTAAGLTEDMIDLGAKAGQSFVDIANALDPENVKSGLFSSSVFEDFASALQDLGQGIMWFYAATKDVGWDVVSEAVANVETLVGLAPLMDGLNVNSATSFNQYMSELGNMTVEGFVNTFREATNRIGNTVYQTLNSALITAKRLLVQTPASYEFIIDSILAGVDGHEEAIAERATNISTIIHDTIVYNTIMFEQLGSLIVASIANGFETSSDDLEDSVTSIADTMVKAANNSLDIRNSNSEEFKQIGKYCIDGLVNGLDGNAATAYRKISEIGNNLISKFENTMGVNSPSKKFAEVGMYSVLGFNKGIDGNLRSAEKTMIKMGEDLLNTIQEFYGIRSPSTLMRDEVGRYVIMGIAEGIENEMSAEEAAAAKARAILEAFQEEFDRWSLNINTAELENKLWSTIHSNATESEVYDQQKILLDKQLTYQAEKVNAANVQYQAILEALGSEAKETQEAYNTYLKEQTTMWEYANEYEKLLTQSGTTLRSASDSYYQILREYGGMLEEAGFTMDQIKEYARKQSGMDAYFNTDTSSILESAQTAAEIVDKYMSSASGSINGIPGQVEYTLEMSLQQVSGTLGSYGSSIGTSLGQGITSSFEQAIGGSGGIGSTIQNALGIEGDNAWDLGSFIGENLGGGGIDGVRNTLKSAGDTGVDWVKNLFQGMTNTAEINSPSKVTYRYGEYIVQGLNNGISDTADIPIDTADTMLSHMFDLISEVPTNWYNIGVAAGQGLANGLRDANSMVRNAAHSLATNAYMASADALDVNSPSKEYYYLGQMMDQGLANGIIDSATVVQRAITKVMDKAQETVSNTNLKAVISPVATSSTRGKAYYTEKVAKMMATDPSFNGQLLQWDATGALIPYGVNNHAQDADKGRWWIAPTAEIAASIRELKDSEDAKRAYEQATIGQYTGTMEELKQAIKELADKPADVSFTQNNYSPSSLSSSTIYRNTRSALATASAAASPTGRSQTGKGVAGGLPMPT